MNERGPAMVRIALFSLLFGAFALALVQPVEAGTPAAPEIQDPARDQTFLDEQNTCLPVAPPSPVPLAQCTGDRIDIISVWLDNETAADLHFNMLLSNAPIGPTTYAPLWRVTFTIAGTQYVASASAGSQPPGGTSPSPAPGGVSTASPAEGNKLILVVPKSAIGNPAAGAMLTGIFAEGLARAPQVAEPPTYIIDRAPNSGSGSDYIFTGGPGGNTTVPGDSDGDLLNDTCEQEFFGGLNGTNNATEDPDGDGLTNGQECASNPRTDPTKADSDGDGAKDKDDPFPTDPTKGGTSSSTNSTTGSGSKTSSTSKSGTGTGSTNSTGTDEGTGEVKTFGDAVEKLKSDIGYIGISAGGLGAVILVAILALAVRWSL